MDHRKMKSFGFLPKYRSLTILLLVTVVVGLCWLGLNARLGGEDMALAFASPQGAMDAGSIYEPLVLNNFSSQNSTPGSIFMPLISKNFPPLSTAFGVEVHSFTDPGVIKLAVDARVSWVRIAAFDWNLIEPEAPIDNVHTYSWNKVAEGSLINIASNHMYAIATVKNTPYWAQKYPPYICGPIASDHLENFANFMKAAVERYSKPPYNVHYWELGNEPDIAKEQVTTPDNPFGCWGEFGDEYFGGRYYAEMLKAVYPVIKSVDSNAQVLIGGLLLDCDPNDPDCTYPVAVKFLDGILENGGAQYFDIVSFHAYPMFATPEDPFYGDLYQYKWDLRGGVLMGKINYINEVMDKYGVSKPIMLTEGGLMCHEASIYCQPAADDFLEAQASYVVWYYVRSWASGLQNAIWYTFEGAGWRDVGMIGSNVANPRPAYYAFRFLTSKLAEAEYTGKEVPSEGALRGYIFSKSGREIWILWPEDGQEHEYTLPAGYSQVLDIFGSQVIPENGAIKINAPIYIDF